MHQMQRRGRQMGAFMNISITKTAGNNGANSIWQKDGKAAPIGIKGQIIEGTITKIGEKVSIDFGDRKVELDSIRDAKIGEIRKFEIMNISDKGIVLREMEDSRNKEKSKGVLCTNVETDKAAFAEQLNQAAGKTEDEKETKDKLEDAGNRMTEEDCKDLEEEGVSLEKYNLERLDRVLARIKEQRSAKASAVEGQVEKNRDYKEDIKKLSESGTQVSARDKRIAEKLAEADLPITKENIEKIAGAMDRAGAAENISDQSKKYLIDRELALTVNNIYQASYAGSRKQDYGYQAGHQNYSDGVVAYQSAADTAKRPAAEEGVWEEIKPQAEKIIEEAGLPVNEETLEKAKWLFEKELPVTEKALKALLQIEKTESEYDTELVLSDIIKAYGQGIPPEQTILGSGKTVTRDTIESFLAKLEHLYQSIDQGSTDIREITARRQIEEIRLKMTVEAGQRLAGKGIELNTTGLEKIVEGLRELEEDYYRNLLGEADAPDTAENRGILKDTLEKVNELKEAPSYVLGVTFRSRGNQTINSLHEEAVGLKAKMDRAEESYDALMTAPRKDLGDSIEKAFQNVDELLKDMNLEATEANRRAVKILGYNSMEINKENIFRVKDYDSQVNAVLTGLHPAVAVEMIKEGFNPLNVPIGELNSEIGRMKEEMGISEEEKFSKFLWKLDQENGISAEERKAFIGVYRLLNSVEKSKGAAVGSVLNAGQEVTLNNLLRAVRTKKMGGMDKEVDDSFGELTKVNHKSQSITEQTAYFSREITELKDHLDLHKWNMAMGQGEEFGQKMEQFMGRQVEGLKETLKAAKGYEEADKKYTAEKIEQLRTLTKEAEGAIGFLTEYGQPITMENLISAKQMMDGGRSVFQDAIRRKGPFSQEDKETLEESLEGLEESLTDAEAMKEQYGKLKKSVGSILERVYEKSEISSEDLASLKLLGNNAKLAYSLSEEEHYEIPLLIGERITSINLTIVKGEEKSGKVHIGMESGQLGKMVAELIIRDSKVKGYVLCNNREGLEVFKEEKENLETAMEGLGLNIGQLDYGMDVSRKGYYSRTGSGGENTDTRTLYQAAKVFVEHIKAAEGRKTERFGTEYEN